MSKVKVKVFKGPNFDLVEEKAYGVLHDILVKKGIEAKRVKKKKDGEVV